MLSESTGSICNEFCRHLPKENIVVWSEVGPVSAIDRGNEARKK